jgi:low affinity Fe/Cu permease
MLLRPISPYLRSMFDVDLAPAAVRATGHLAKLDLWYSGCFARLGGSGRRDLARSTAVNEFFRKFAHKTAEIVGSPWVFIVAVLIIIIWVVSGPAFGFSDTWQLVINTGTTIITFLMVFLIQNSQNRDAKATHLKLDELLRAVGEARTALVDLEDMSDEDLKQLQEEFKRLHERYGNTLHPHLEAIEDEIEERGSQGGSKREQTD